MIDNRSRVDFHQTTTKGTTHASHLINPFEVQKESVANQEAALIAAFHKTTSVFAGRPGYLETKLYRSLDPAARFRFVNVAHWSSAEAWQSAMKASPPQEKEVSAFHANPTLYEPVPGAEIKERSVTVETVLREIEEGLARAYQTNDTAFMDRVLADDYVLNTGAGTTADKRTLLDDHANARWQVTRFQFDEMLIESLGADAAMVLGQFTWDAVHAGQPVPGKVRYLRVYARSDAGWQVRAAQYTPVSA